MGESQFTVTDHAAPLLAVDHDIGAIARRLAEDAAAGSPVDTDELAAGYYTVREGPAHYAVRNDVPYWRFVEFGTRYDQAQPAMGPALALARSRLER